MSSSVSISLFLPAWRPARRSPRRPTNAAEGDAGGTHSKKLLHALFTSHSKCVISAAVAFSCCALLHEWAEFFLPCAPLKPSIKRVEFYSKMCRCVASEALLWQLPAIAAEAAASNLARESQRSARVQSRPFDVQMLHQLCFQQSGLVGHAPQRHQQGDGRRHKRNRQLELGRAQHPLLHVRCMRVNL